jgi:hypothetical protein
MSTQVLIWLVAFGTQGVSQESQNDLGGHEFWRAQRPGEAEHRVKEI